MKTSNIMPGLVENNYRENPVWIKSCENFRSGENIFRQPKYFHTDDNMLVRDWYKAAYPTDTWGAEQIDSTIKFNEVTPVLQYIREDVVICSIRRLTGDFAGHIMSFSDSVVEKRIWKELNVNEGPSFGYIMEE